MGLFSKIFNRSKGNNRPQEDIDFENQVKKDGYEYAGKRIADEINEKITSQDLAKQFILEELDVARQGNEYTQNFVKNTGFKSFEYVGAINKTRWEGDESELEYLQLFLRVFTSKISDTELMIKVSIAVIEEVMKSWGLGKYNISNEQIQNILDWADSNNISENIIPRNKKELLLINELDFTMNLPDWIKLPNEICYLYNLTTLKLFHNNICYLPNDIGNLINLETLDLGVTNIYHFPNSVVKLRKLKKLNLYGLSDLELTQEQWEWLKYLRKKECFINE